MVRQLPKQWWAINITHWGSLRKTLNATASQAQFTAPPGDKSNVEKNFLLFPIKKVSIIVIIKWKERGRESVRLHQLCSPVILDLVLNTPH